MGIDVYAHWRGQTRKEKQSQITGWSIAHGHVGYLREAYHGAPYATRVLAPEAFAQGADPEGTAIRAAVLRERLPLVLATAREREERIYRNGPDSADTAMVCKSFVDFVELCERQEARTGEPCMIYASW
jgi:hypothetical protein